MGFLDDLVGGKLQKQFEDFVHRYERGHPSEGYTDEEVVDRYSEVAHSVPRQDYAAAAQEALARLSPEEREAFVKMLQERARAKGVALPGQVRPDPEDLGRVVTDLHEKPGQLRDVLGGGGQASSSAAGALSGMLASPLAKAALAGITAMLVKRVMRGSAGR